jgi:hypothetical protein
MAGKVLAYLVQRWRLAHLEQELAKAEHSLLGRGLLRRDQLSLLLQRAPDLLDDRSPTLPTGGFDLETGHLSGHRGKPQGV